MTMEKEVVEAGEHWLLASVEHHIFETLNCDILNMIELISEDTTAPKEG